jgi:hypothetical protein
VVFALVWFVLFAFVVPRPYFGFYVACLAMPALVGWICPTGTDHSSPFSGTGNAIYALICIVVGLALAVRAGIIALWPRPSQAPAHPAAWVAMAAVTAPCIMTILSLGWSEMRPVWMAYIPALAIVGGSLVQLVACWWVTNARFRAYALGLAVSAVASFAAAAIWMAGHAGAVIDAAERIAGDKPYCIQVASTRPFGYLARSKLAFSPLTMRTKCREGWCFENHAVLAVDVDGGRTLMNWSYRFGEFRNEVLNAKTKPEPVHCQPVPHFARDLPLLFP